jgi:hypothetical protein
MHDSWQLISQVKSSQSELVYATNYLQNHFRITYSNNAIVQS